MIRLLLGLRATWERDKIKHLPHLLIVLCVCHALGQSIGQEAAVAKHLGDGAEARVSLADLLSHGRLLFDANWTEQEGGGRPLTKGTGRPLSDATHPAVPSR